MICLVLCSHPFYRYLQTWDRQTNRQTTVNNTVLVTVTAVLINIFNTTTNNNIFINFVLVLICLVLWLKKIHFISLDGNGHMIKTLPTSPPDNKKKPAAIGHMIKNHSDSEIVIGNLRLPLHGLLFPISSNGSIDRIAHTTAFATTVVEHWPEREIAQWVYHEGSIRRPIAPWANALTTELHLALSLLWSG